MSSPCIAFGVPLLVALAVGFPAFGQEEGEEEEKQLREFMFLAEHKTGNDFTTLLLRNCLVEKGGWPLLWWVADTTVKTMADPTVHGEWGKIVYMVRNPFEVIRSSYFYELNSTKSGSEGNFGEPATWRFHNGSRVHEKPRPDETFNAYLNRVSMDDGIVAEMSGGPAAQSIQRLERNHASCDEQKILCVCMDDVFRAFDSTVRSVLRHLGVAAGGYVWGCAQSLNPTKHNSEHGTHDVEEGARQQAMKLAKESE